MAEKSVSILSDKELKHFQGYDFPFENFVLEGGGAKLAGSVGTVLALEELGVLRKMKRFGGTSAGSFVAAMLALGYNGKEVQELMAVNLNDKIRDEWFSVSYLFNLWKYFGAHRGRTLMKWLGELVADKMDGDPNATFWQLYEKTGMELCIVTTELMQREAVYYHVKTTPHRAIKDAVFMSMSIPGFLVPTIYKDQTGNQEVFVDGGVIYNYPIHCYDGWFLSPGAENDFFKKHMELDEDEHSFWQEKDRFIGRNENTIGLMVYQQKGDKPSLQDQLEKRNADYLKQDITETETFGMTTLKRQYTKQNPDTKQEDYVKHKEAQLRLDIAIATQCGVDLPDQTDGKKFDDADAETLYGPGVTAEKAIAECRNEHNHDNGNDSTDDGEESMLIRPVGAGFDRKMVDKASTGLELIRREQINDETEEPQHVDGIVEFLSSVVDFYGEQVMRLNQRPEDYDRTIGVDVDYLGTLDFEMEEEDRNCLIYQSKVACLAFLDEYIRNNELKKTVN